MKKLIPTLLLLISSCLAFANQDNVEYYDFLQTLQGLSDSTQLEHTLNYLYDHPDFWKIYEKAYRLFTYTGQKEKAYTFYANLVNDKQYSPYANLYLSKLYREDNKADFAKQYFISGLEQRQDYYIISEYAKNYTNSSQIDSIAKSLLDSTQLLMANGMSNYYKAKYTEAIDLLEQVLQHDNNLNLQIMLGYCYIINNQHQQADSVFEAGYNDAIKQYNIDGQIIFLQSLGKLALTQNNYNKAETLLNKALEKSDEIIDYRRKITTFNELGKLKQKQDKTDSSLVYFNLAQSYSDKFKGEIQLAQVLRNGYNFHLHHQYSQAVQCYKESIELIEPNDWNNELRVKSLLVTLYERFGMISLMNQMLAECKVLANENNYISTQKWVELQEIKNQLSLDNLDIQRKNLVKLYNYYLNKGNNNLYGCLHTLAKSYIIEHKYKKAQTFYQLALDQAIKTNNQSKIAYYYARLAFWDIKCDETDKALARLDSAKTIINKIDDSYMARFVYRTTGLAHEKAADYDSALVYYYKAIPHTERLRNKLSAEDLRIGVFSSDASIYQGIARSYLQKYISSNNSSLLDSLYKYEESFRSRALKDRMDNRNIMSGSGKPTNEYSQAMEMISDLQQKLRKQAGTEHTDPEWDQLMGDLEAAKYTLIQQRIFMIDSLKTSQQKDSGTSVQLSEIRKQLEKNNAGLLEYHIDSEISFVLVVTPDTTHTVLLATSQDSLSKKIKKLMSPLHDLQEQDPKIPFYAQTAYQLYAEIFNPIEKEIKLPENLLVIPDGPLMNLPFEMLVTHKPNKAAYTPLDEPDYSNSFLLNQYSLFYSPTSNILKKSGLKLLNRPNMMVFANPFSNVNEISDNVLQYRSRTGWNFQALPFAELEANEISKLTSRVKLYKRQNAIETYFSQNASKYDILHLATHAFVDTSFEAFSGLILASSEDSTNDGILMGYEIEDLDLDCELVTLSACETGRGKNMAAEGLLGLPRLFMGAGAKSVLMSHWKVDDRFTSKLMPLFYHYYLTKKMDKADALANAKRDLIKSSQEINGEHYQHPLYWAAFTLYGNPDKITNTSPILPAAILGSIFIFAILGGAVVKKKKSTKKSGHLN